MNNDDLQKLKAAAETAIRGPWEHLLDTKYCSIASPSAILALIYEVEQARAAKQEPKYGCHIDLPSPEWDACVLDDGNPADCMYAERYGEEGRKKCGEWKPVVFVPAQTLHKE